MGKKIKKETTLSRARPRSLACSFIPVCARNDFEQDVLRLGQVFSLLLALSASAGTGTGRRAR